MSYYLHAAGVPPHGGKFFAELAVGETAVAVEYESPFSEIAQHVGGMDFKHPAVLSGGGTVVMDYACAREIDGFISFMDSPGEVYILRIHEEPLVK